MPARRRTREIGIVDKEFDSEIFAAEGLCWISDLADLQDQMFDQNVIQIAANRGSDAL